MCQAVDLEEEEAGYVRALGRGGAPRVAADHVPVPEGVVVDCEQRGDRRVDHSDPEGDNHASEDGRHLQAGLDLRHRDDQESVEDNHAEPEREHRERQREPDHHRPHECVQEPDHGCGGERCPEVPHLDAGEKGAQNEQRRRREHPHEDDAQDREGPSPRAHGAVRRSP